MFPQAFTNLGKNCLPKRLPTKLKTFHLSPYQPSWKLFTQPLTNLVKNCLPKPLPTQPKNVHLNPYQPGQKLFLLSPYRPGQKLFTLSLTSPAENCSPKPLLTWPKTFYPSLTNLAEKYSSEALTTKLKVVPLRLYWFGLKSFTQGLTHSALNCSFHSPGVKKINFYLPRLY